MEETLKRHAPSEGFGGRVRQVLEGVPKIGYQVYCSPFPGSLVALMAYIGDPCPYEYLMGVTGAAFRRLFEKDDGGNVDLMYLAPEPHRRAFAALGYHCQTVPHSDKAAMVRAIKASIDQGRPVLAFGIIGPPEAGLVTGYDQDGEVLYGYSYFQDPSIRGYYEKSGWFETMDRGCAYGLIVVGEKTERPPERETLSSTLAWAVDLARTPRRVGRPQHLSGLAAYEAWAAALEVDEDYPDNAEVLGVRAMVHADQTMMLGERQFAARYLRSMVEVAPEAAEHLQAAAALYDEVAAYEGKVWHWGPSMGPEVGRGLLDPARRREIAQHVRSAAEKEARAVEALERALAAV